jgi:DNA-binding transcriptional regulator YhcF (GntR family)
MQFSIDPHAAAAPYEQLRLQLLERMLSGELAHGAKLPTVRGLADELGLAPNTVARCYRELELSGAIETRGRNGSFAAWSPDAAERRLEQAAAALVVVARELGVPSERVVEIVEAALATPSVE